jgi:hypothetical protein
MEHNLKMTVFRIVAPCSLVEVHRRFRSACCLYHQGDDAANTFETSVNFYQATRRNNPEDSNLHTRRRENLKSHMEEMVLLSSGYHPRMFPRETGEKHESHSQHIPLRNSKR